MGLGKIGGTPASPLAGGLPPLVDLDRGLAAGSRCAQCPGETPSPDTQCMSRPHFVQFGTHVPELALEISLHGEEFEPEHLGVDRDRMIASTGSLRFVDELIRRDGLLGPGPDGLLEDLDSCRAMGRPAEPTRPCQPRLSSRRSLRRR